MKSHFLALCAAIAVIGAANVADADAVEEKVGDSARSLAERGAALRHQRELQSRREKLLAELAAVEKEANTNFASGKAKAPHKASVRPPPRHMPAMPSMSGGGGGSHAMVSTDVHTLEAPQLLPHSDHSFDEPNTAFRAHHQKHNQHANAQQREELGDNNAAESEKYRVPKKPTYMGPPIPAICGQPGQFHSDGIVFTGHHRCNLDSIFGGGQGREGDTEAQLEMRRSASVANAKSIYPAHKHRDLELAHAIHMMVRLTFVHAEKVLMTITAFPIMDHEMCTKIKVVPNRDGNNGGVTLDMSQCEVFKADPLFEKGFAQTAGIFHFPCVEPEDRYKHIAPKRISLENLSPHLPPVTVEVTAEQHSANIRQREWARQRAERAEL